MFGGSSKRIVLQLLSDAKVFVNGPNSWDIHVKNEKFYNRVLTQATLGLGESYMDGWWKCEQLDEMVFRLLRAEVDKKSIKKLGLIYDFLFYKIRKCLVKFINLQSKVRSKDVAYKHYNIGNDLFTRMLDPSMNYSCGYWKDSETLEDAQKAKMALICGKLQLRPGMKVLDIGCGWGGFAEYAAKNYSVSVTGVTISEEQYKLAKKRCADLPVEFLLQDYRDVQGKFDRIVSVGMFEHVGHKNYRTFMEVVYRLLENEGLMLLHTIGGNQSLFVTDPWINKYIFPNGLIPSIKQIGDATEDLFIMEDWHNFGADYDKTLMAWYRNFIEHWPEIQAENRKYDDQFYLMWTYYLLVCAGAFRARDLQLWQIVFSKNGVLGGYQSIR